MVKVLKETLSEEFEIAGVDVIFWQIPLLSGLVSFFAIIVIMGV